MRYWARPASFCCCSRCSSAAIPRVTWALVVLVIAALGGLYLASLHRRQTLPPKGIVLLHAGLAVVGFGLLLTVLLG